MLNARPVMTNGFDKPFSSFQCEELWQGKAHIPRSSQARGLSKLEAYSFSVLDGKRVSGYFLP